jgi:hypothetical protein
MATGQAADAAAERHAQRFSSFWPMGHRRDQTNGSPSMAETRKWLGHAGNSSYSLAQDTALIAPNDHETPFAHHGS